MVVLDVHLVESHILGKVCSYFFLFVSSTPKLFLKMIDLQSEIADNMLSVLVNNVAFGL